MRYNNPMESQYLRRRAAGPVRAAALRHLPLPIGGHGERFRPARVTLRGFGANTAATAALSTARGASTGAAAGATAAGIIGASAAAGSVVPVIGTAIGAIVGLLASGVFDRQDQEISDFNSAIQIYQHYGPQGVINIGNKYLVLAGLFDLQPSQIKGNIPFYRKYGRANEQRFVTDMVNLIANAATAGQITGNDTPQSIFTRIVQPWMGTVVDNNADLINYAIMGMIAEYVAGLQTRWLARSGDWPFAGLPKFVLPTTNSSAPAPVSPTSNPTDGQTLIIGGSGNVSTGDGTWSFGPGANANGGQVMLNGSPQPGVFAIGLTTRGGSVYQVNQGGAWYSKAPGQGWAPSSAPPNGNAVYSSALQMIQQNTPATAPAAPAMSTAASVPATTPSSSTSLPNVGDSITSAINPNNGLPMALPPGATFGGLTPSGAWIITYASGPNAGSYTLFNGQLIPWSTPANPLPIPAPSPVATGDQIQGSGILSLPSPAPSSVTTPTTAPSSQAITSSPGSIGTSYYANEPTVSSVTPLTVTPVSGGTDNSFLWIGAAALALLLLTRKGAL